MSRFILLLHESPTPFAGVSAEEIQAVVQEYGAWRQKLADEGRLVGGEKLEDGTARQLSATDGRIDVTDGPFAEAKEVIGGYFMIEAGDYDEAVTISRECPHLKYGGRVELRRIEELHQSD